MSKKRKATDKKPKKATVHSVGSSRARSLAPKGQSADSAGSSVSTGSHSGVTSQGKARGGEFATFPQAKSAAIDALIETIEDAERRLAAVKRANSYDELQRLAKGTAV